MPDSKIPTKLAEYKGTGVAIASLIAMVAIVYLFMGQMDGLSANISENSKALNKINETLASNEATFNSQKDLLKELANIIKEYEQ